MRVLRLVRLATGSDGNLDLGLLGEIPGGQDRDGKSALLRAAGGGEVSRVDSGVGARADRRLLNDLLLNELQHISQHISGCSSEAGTGLARGKTHNFIARLVPLLDKT